MLPNSLQEKYSVNEVVASVTDIASQTVEWLGRKVSYVAHVIADYATKAWEYAAAFFKDYAAKAWGYATTFFNVAKDFVTQHQVAFAYVGVAAVIAGIGYLFAKAFGCCREKATA